MDNLEIFTHLGLLYRKKRIEQKIKLSTLAARCAISMDTLRSIERGSPNVKIGSWFAVAQALNLSQAWQGLLTEETDPFEEYDRQALRVTQLLKTRVRS